MHLPLACQSTRTFHIALLGIGRSNLAAMEYFLALGHRVTVFDTRESHRPKDGTLPGNALYGGPFPDTPAPFDLVLRAPGLRVPDGFIADCARREIPLTTETGLFLKIAPFPTYGVTGSDGKSTTATVAAACLSAAGIPAPAVGNIGTPAISLLSPKRRGTAPRAAVVELSSFQLLDTLAPPTYAALTNLSPNHLDFHRDFAEYAAAKARILGGAALPALPLSPPLPDVFPLPEKAVYTAPFPLPDNRDGVFIEGDTLFGKEDRTVTPLVDLHAFPLVGEHNRKNLATAVLLTRDALSSSVLRSVLPRLSPLPHRMEHVATLDGRDCIDSSIDSSPDRTATTLRSLGRPAAVIVGGRTKGLPLDPLADTLASYAAAVVLLGESTPTLLKILEESPAFSEKGIPLAVAKTMPEAVRLAAAISPENAPILLSPACTSFDLFSDYRERGNAFRAAALALGATPR